MTGLEPMQLIGGFYPYYQPTSKKFVGRQKKLDFPLYFVAGR
jgi:hypothetical protein